MICGLRQPGRIRHCCGVLSEAEARLVAEAALSPKLQPGKVAITRVEEHDIGWAFYYQSARFIATGKIDDALAGNAPVLVSRRDGQVLPTGTAMPLDSYIEEHQRRRAWEEQASERERVLTEAIQELSVIGPEMKRPVLDRLRAKFAASSEVTLAQAVEEATRIGERALELSQTSHDCTEVSGRLAAEYPQVYPEAWDRLWYRAEYRWKWDG